METSIAITKPWFSHLRQHPARKCTASILGHIHRLTYLLTCPGP